MRILYIFSSIRGHIKKGLQHRKDPKMIELAKALQDANSEIVVECFCKECCYRDQTPKKGIEQ
jgi:hypothetical protein